MDDTVTILTLPSFHNDQCLIKEDIHLVGKGWDQGLGRQNGHLNPRDILKFNVRSSTKATYTWFCFGPKKRSSVGLVQKLRKPERFSAGGKTSKLYSITFLDVLFLFADGQTGATPQ
jgi:hypothetical protein